MMRVSQLLALPILISSAALAGPQYTADDIIRYFEQAKPAMAPGHSPHSGKGDKNPAVLPDAGLSDGEQPLVIPMTGVKAGLNRGGAKPPRITQGKTAGYDLLITFELNSANLTRQARQNLDAFARALATPTLSEHRFTIEGHTDSSGSREHNMKLSKARAVSVVSYLVEKGVDPGRLKAEGYGPTRPRFKDPSHPENRRVETKAAD